MNILFTICARAGSKGIHNKNLRLFLGYPLPFYTISAIDLFINRYPSNKYDVVLNTDSNDLIDMFNEHVEIKYDVIRRDESLAGDFVPKIAVVKNCLETMEERHDIYYNMVVDIDVTSPLRTIEDIQNIIKKKIDSDADVVFSVVESRRNPYFNMIIEVNGEYRKVIQSSFVARQQAPAVYDMNASLYAFEPTYLKSGKSLFDGKCDIIKMRDTAVLDLDNENDFDMMQVIAKYLFEKLPEYREIRDNLCNCIK